MEIDLEMFGEAQAGGDRYDLISSNNKAYQIDNNEIEEATIDDMLSALSDSDFIPSQSDPGSYDISNNYDNGSDDANYDVSGSGNEYDNTYDFEEGTSSSGSIKEGAQEEERRKKKYHSILCRLDLIADILDCSNNFYIPKSVSSLQKTVLMSLREEFQRHGSNIALVCNIYNIVEVE